MIEKAKRKAYTLCRMLLLCSFLLVNVTVFAWQGRISLSEKSITIKSAIEKIEKLSGYNFLYNSKLVNVSKVVSVEVKDTDLAAALTALFRNTGIEFQIRDKQIILTAAPKNAAQAGKSVKSANLRSVKGVVTDEAGEPLPGCAVIDEISKRATTADANGKYELEVGDACKLEFSFIGMKTIYQTPQGDLCNVVMTPDFMNLDQVVVTGYQTMKKFNTTGAINSVDTKKLDLRSSQTLDKVLEGSVAGLTVYNGEYRIRGGSTLAQETKPMFIVDDFEVETLPENMDQVESITVLKDAAAAAIWGSKAANGVIVITTKQGKVDDFKVSYSNNFKVGSKPDFSDLRRAGSADMVDYQKESYLKGYVEPMMYEGSKSGYPITYPVFFDHAAGNITDSEMNSRLAQIGSLSNREQIEKNLLRNSFSQNHLLAISGGTKKMNYYLSTSYIGGHSAYEGDSDNAVNINFRGTYKLYSFLKLRADLTANFASMNNGYDYLQSDIYGLYPFQMLQDDNGANVYDYSNFNEVEGKRLKEKGYLEFGKNLIEENALANNKSKTTTYRTRFGADFNIIEGLTANVDFMYEAVNGSTKNIWDKNSYGTRELVNQFTEDNGTKLIQHIPFGDVLNKTNIAKTNWVGKAVVNLNRSFGRDKKHYVNAIAGFEIRKYISDTEQYRKVGYNDQLLTWYTLDQKFLAEQGVEWWDGRKYSYYADKYDAFKYRDNRETSVYGSAVYTYDNRYTVSGSLRFDESNLFGADKKFRRNPIWSIGASWNITQEKFFKSKVITDLTLRATTGLTGNFDRGSETSPLMVAKRLYLSSVSNYITRIVTPPNPSLRWEKNRSVNISASIGLWNRLSISADYYNNFCYDLLGTQELDPTLGYGRAYINAADMINKGVELVINGDIIRTKKVIWNANLVFSYNKNEVTKNSIYDSAPHLNRVSGTTKFVEGYPRETIWSYKWAGLDKEGNPQTYDEKGEKTFIPSLASIEANGTYQPKFNGSFSTGVSYAGFTLNMMFTYNFGHKFRMEYPNMNPYETPSISNLIANRWKNPGDENNPDMLPSIWTVDWANYIQHRDKLATNSSNSIRNAGFVRLREILLNYEFPTRMIKKTPFKRIGVTVQANNVALWTVNKEGIDPEAVSPLTGRLSLVNPLTFTFGLKLDF